MRVVVTAATTATTATTTTVRAPSVREAQRAADRLAAAGAGRVLLFGSVARGSATADSDIDLVAIFDDIDYTERRHIRSALREAAESVVERPVEVFVTDRAEWRRRTREVSASFEAGIAAAALVLVDRPAGAVRWDKEIGLPDNNTDEALRRLDDALSRRGSGAFAHRLAGRLTGRDFGLCGGFAGNARTPCPHGLLCAP